jgi:hypothetical protein
MTVTFRKAGEAVATRVIHSTKGTGLKAVSSSDPKIELKVPRAVDKDEAPSIKPAKESTKETMMPWRGWINRFLKDKLDEKNYNKLRNTFYFMPEDVHNLQQVPMPVTKVPIAPGKEAAFREVSPGSQGPVKVPLEELDSDPYDTAYFKRDTRRRYVDPEFPHPEIAQIKLDMLNPDDSEVQEAKKKLAAGPLSSPGNKGRFATGPSDFDPSGLRAVMSVTHAALQKELDKHMPDHLPTPSWTKDEAELFAYYKENDLPVPIGGHFNFISKHRRVARW